MLRLHEGQLEFTFTDAVHGCKFDDPKTHRASSMKAVDFIVDFTTYDLFVEVKDPDDTGATPARRQTFAEKMRSGTLESSLKYKYRDSLLYRWASDAVRKPIKYIVLLQMERLRPRDYQLLTDRLTRVIPLRGPCTWRRPIVTEVAVMNMVTWNKIGTFGTVRRRE